MFTFVFSDTVIAGNLTNVVAVFNSSTNPTSACYIIYSTLNSTVSLLTDSGTASTSVAIGSTGSLQNSQCAISTTSASQTALTLTFSLLVTFKGAFDGVKNIYMAASTSFSSTGLLQMGTYNVNGGGVPLGVSVVPGAGTGAGERFSFIVSDQGGAGFITGAAFLFQSTFNMNNACYLIWDSTHNTLSLTFDNPANGQTPFTPGSPGIATNEQCTMNAANSTVVFGATQVIITVDLTFNSTFFGPKTIFLFASEVGINSGWITVGNWTVTGGAATANSVSPSSGSGTSPTFLFTVSDSSSQTNITGMSMLLANGAPTNIANACYLVYNRTNATIGLWDSTGNTTLSTKGIGSAANLLNSQCAVGFTAMNVVGGAIQLSIQLVFFKPAFAGPQSIYLDATEPNSSSGFVYQGSWTVQ